MVKAKDDETVQLCSCSRLPKRSEGCIFWRARFLKFTVSLRCHQCNYCYKLKNKCLDLKHLLLPKLKTADSKSC